MLIYLLQEFYFESTNRNSLSNANRKWDDVKGNFLFCVFCLVSVSGFSVEVSDIERVLSRAASAGPASVSFISLQNHKTAGI